MSDCIRHQPRNMCACSNCMAGYPKFGICEDCLNSIEKPSAFAPWSESASARGHIAWAQTPEINGQPSNVQIIREMEQELDQMILKYSKKYEISVGEVVGLMTIKAIQLSTNAMDAVNKPLAEQARTQ